MSSYREIADSLSSYFEAYEDPFRVPFLQTTLGDYVKIMWRARACTHDTTRHYMVEENAKFHRWQRIAMDQLGYALNLILTFTVATLGYWFVLLKDKDFTPSPSARCMMLLSLLALGSSAICGLACVVNRLRDSRGTAQRVRSDSSREAPTKEYLDGLGRATWVLFYCHLSAFALGVALLAAALLLTYGGKLL